MLITIEGIDGSGKGTQAQLLLKRLLAKGVSAKLYSFPNYQTTFFGKEIGAFLRGEFGSLEQVHPKLAAILFAGDRFEQKQALQNDLNNGLYVICDRYVDSNIAHQCAKLPEEKMPEFCQWLECLEYEVFGMPRPDITFFLDVPLSVSKELVLQKQQRIYMDEKEDIHEQAYLYLERVSLVYKKLLEYIGNTEHKSWIKIECMRCSFLRSADQINQDLLGQIMGVCSV